MTKTDIIFQLTSPYDNIFQGTDKRLLFVCSAGLLRSATAANLFAKRGFNTRSCGSAPYALIPLSANLIAWADKIYFVNKSNILEAINTFAGKKEYLEMIEDKSTVLDIPDIYSYNEEELVKLLEEQVIV